MSDLPVWIQLSVASIPLLAAMIAGAFGLANTVNRRVERLKNLNELYATFPKNAVPHNALEQIMLREVRAIDFATNPQHKWDKRIHVAVGVFVAVGASIVILGMFSDSDALRTIGTGIASISALLIGVWVVWLNLHVEPLRASNAYFQKAQELKG